MHIETWRGESTVSEAVRRIGAGETVRIDFEPERHNVIYSLFGERLELDVEPYPAAIVGGRELIDTLATVAGLEPLKTLAGPVGRAGYVVRVTTPAPCLVLLPAQDAGSGLAAASISRQGSGF